MLRLWCLPAAMIQPLAWELPYAAERKKPKHKHLSHFPQSQSKLLSQYLDPAVFRVNILNHTILPPLSVEGKGEVELEPTGGQSGLHYNLRSQGAPSMCRPPLLFTYRNTDECYNKLE